MEAKMILTLFALLNIMSSIYSAITLPSFDIREKFSHCYHESYSTVTSLGRTCNTNWPIQFSLTVSDKICTVKKIVPSNTVSPQNIISCLGYKVGTYTCDNTFQQTSPSATTLIADTITYFNKYGSQTIEQNPYSYDASGNFPACTNATSSFGDLTITPQYLDEVKDIDAIKTLILTEGPVLGYMSVTKKINDYDGSLWVDDASKGFSEFTFVRIIGWQMAQGVPCWTFSYTRDTAWGVMGYGLVQQGLYDIQVINLMLK